MMTLLGNKLGRGRLSLPVAGETSADGESNCQEARNGSPSQKLPERISTRILHRDGCWLWTSDQNTAGYGEVYYRGQMRPAHRVVYELVRGHPAPAGLAHSCGTRRCVKPDHLNQPEPPTQEALTDA